MAFLYMISQAIAIWVYIAANVEGQFTNDQNNVIKGQQDNSVSHRELRNVQDSECQCNQVQRTSDAWIIECRLCANAITARNLFLKVALNATVVVSWHPPDTGCTLGDFGKTHFISCEVNVQNNLVVLHFVPKLANRSFRYDEDTWTCAGEADDFGSKKIYFSKWSDNLFCRTSKEQGFYLSTEIQPKGENKDQMSDSQTPLQSCVHCSSCLQGEKGNTSLKLNISCQRKLIRYCLMQPGNVSYCCDQGMVDKTEVVLNCQGDIKGPKIHEVLINNSLLVLGECLQLQVTLNDSITYNLACTCNPSSPCDSYQNNPKNMIGSISTKNESSRIYFVIGLSIVSSFLSF